MTITTFFRFTDEAEAQPVLQLDEYYIPEEVIIDEETGKVIETFPAYYRKADLGWVLNIISTIYHDDSVIDPDTGKVIMPPTPMPGWHLNFSCPYAQSLETYRIEPQNPYRKFL